MVEMHPGGGGRPGAAGAVQRPGRAEGVDGRGGGEHGAGGAAAAALVLPAGWSGRD